MLEELRRDDLTVDDWQVAPVVEELATRSSLLRLLGGDRTLRCCSPPPTASDSPRTMPFSALNRAPWSASTGSRASR